MKSAHIYQVLEESFLYVVDQSPFMEFTAAGTEMTYTYMLTNGIATDNSVTGRIKEHNGAPGSVIEHNRQTLSAVPLNLYMS